jgi:hypothetical protein
MAHETDPPSDSAIYIAVDPNWDPSQGDATLFFVSPPMDLGGLEDSECCLTPSFRDSAERNSSKTSVRRLASASAHQLFRPWREDVSPAHF